MDRDWPAALAPNAAAPMAEDTPSFSVTNVNSTPLSDSAERNPRREGGEETKVEYDFLV